MDPETQGTQETPGSQEVQETPGSQEVQSGAVASAAPRIVTQEIKDKQALAMKERWQSPIYKTRVTKGRLEKKIEKLKTDVVATEEAELKAKLETALAKAEADLATVSVDLAQMEADEKAKKEAEKPVQ